MAKSRCGTKFNTVWAPFNDDTTYFDPSKNGFMINYIVEDIEELLSLLKNEGIDQIEELQQFAFGKFAQILDPEENKIEFWEPDKQFFEQRYKELGCTV